MRRLPMLLFVALFVVPLVAGTVAATVVGQAYGCWVLLLGDTVVDHLAGAALFILPAALLGLVAGAVLGRRGVWVLLVPLGEVVFLVAQTWGSPYELSAIVLVPLIAAVPYVVGWWVGWAIRIRRAAAGHRAAAGPRAVLRSGPNWTSSDVEPRC